jgi:hypothetical protein
MALPPLLIRIARLEKLAVVQSLDTLKKGREFKQ